MSSGQKHLYWRSWSAVVAKHGWRGKAAEMRAARPACWASPELNPILAGVWEFAERLAAQEHRALAADDLRRACSMVATGRLVSSKRLSNAELDRVLALFRLLAEPDNLAAVRAWFDSDGGERRRHLYVIRQSPPAYVSAIARDKFGTTDLDRLTLEQLRQLSLTLRNRPAARVQSAATPAPATIELCPA